MAKERTLRNSKEWYNSVRHGQEFGCLKGCVDEPFSAPMSSHCETRYFSRRPMVIELILGVFQALVTRDIE